MTQPQKYNLQQWLKIASIVGATITFAVQTGTLIKKGTEWYSGIIVVMGNQKNIDDAQNNLLNRDNQLLTIHDSLLNDHERRLSRTEIDLQLIELDQPKKYKYHLNK